MLKSNTLSNKNDYWKWIESQEILHRYHHSEFTEPDQYPSIVVLQESYNDRYGRWYISEEVVYLEDFGPLCQLGRPCEADQYKECRWCGKDMWDDYQPGDTL